MTQVVDPGFSRRRLDRYELIAEIASGGMGVVLLGRIAGAGGFERLFAIKMMHPHLMEEPQFVAMLLDEARVAAKIHHPNVVAMVDVCSTGSNYCLVMDYVNGFPLLDILDHPEIPPTKRIRAVLRILMDVMQGLEAAHNLRNDDGLPVGIVHRDVSPQNVLVGIDGVARLTDFGIALAASRISASRPGMIKGKPGYMAPEQARANKVDRRADLWALGVMLWEAVAGQRLFTADTEAAIVLKVIEAPIPPLREVAPDTPPELEAICARALQRDPAARYASAREMAADLERVAAPRGLLADSHEVSDLIRQSFAAEIDQRRKAIRRHIQAIGPNSGPITLREAYELPNLRDAVTGVEGISSANSRAPTAPLLLSTPSRRSQTTDPAVYRSTTGGATADLESGRSKRSAAFFISLGVILLSLGAVALKFAWFDRPPTPSADQDRPPGKTPETSPPPAAAGPAISAETTPKVDPISNAEPVELGSATPVQSGRPAAPPRRGGGRHATPVTPPTARPVVPSPPRSASVSPPGAPTIEENPYRLR
ncbi:MAG TPA: protein kinase [Polyangiaceae bacterium]